MATLLLFPSHDLHVTPLTERELFREQLIIPDFFAVYIGKHNESSDTAWVRTSQTVARSPCGPNPPLGDLKRNMQSIAFICGSLFVFVLAIRENGINPAEFLHLPKLTQIFPMKFDVVKWPPDNILNKADMGQAAWALDEMTNMSNVRYGGELP